MPFPSERDGCGPSRRQHPSCGASQQKPPGLLGAGPGELPSSGGLLALVDCDLQLFSSDQCGLTPDSGTPTHPCATSQDFGDVREGIPL